MTEERLCIDSSVLLASTVPSEGHHAEAIAFLKRAHAAARAGEVEVCCPAIGFLEIFSAFGRQKERQDRALLDDIMPEASGLPMSICEISVQDSLNFITDHQRLCGDKSLVRRGADLMWLAVARKYNCTLVSCDTGVLGYNGKICSIVRPKDWLRRVDRKPPAPGQVPTGSIIGPLKPGT